jgi:glycosyltransferase involved in cell wall biosynthesis
VAAVVRGVLALDLAVVVVDDGSDDDTGEHARAAGAPVLRHVENRGKGAALRTGMQWARARGHDTIVCLDADGQHDPAEIPRLLAAAENAELVIGARERDPSRMPWTRRCTNGTSSYLITKICGRPIADSQSGFRVLRGRALDLLPDHYNRYDTESEWLIRIAREKLRIAEVPIKTIYGPPSRYRAVMDTLLIARVIIRNL